MADDETLQVVIGDRVVQCRSVDDKMRLEPVGGILFDGSVEGYRAEELDEMVRALERYGMREEAMQLRQLRAK
jgi:hypothetical protein